MLNREVFAAGMYKMFLMPSRPFEVPPCLPEIPIGYEKCRLKRAVVKTVVFTILLYEIYH